MSSDANGPRAKATPYNIQLSPTSTQGFTHVNILTQESADKVSDLLMLNHAKYHTYFNEVGLHNHIVHHLLSIWALGATPSEVQAAYDLNKKYQLPQRVPQTSVALKMKDPSFFKDCLGKNKFYTSYLHFFQEEINQRGVEEVLLEYVFKGNERADDILGRMHAGFLHPIIHLGFALEFDQPCLAAEALAGASIHNNLPLAIVQPVEEYIRSHPNLPDNSLLSVMDSLRSDSFIKSAVKLNNSPDKLTDGLMKHAAKEIIPHLGKWRVKPTQEDIDYRTAEMIHTCVLISGAAQNPRKSISIDFFLMHSTNLSIFYPTFAKLEWLSLEAKARLLTWKGWMDAALYAACGSPELFPSRITRYIPKSPGPWSSVISRATHYPDDGHTSKLIRAILNGQHISEPFSGDPNFPLKKGDFLQIAHMTMDSVERMNEPGYVLPEGIRKVYIERLGENEEVARIIARFVRWCGLEKAWDEVPDLDEGSKAKL
ncbi:hypothetical protein CC78DRAFT_553292 [Lojkania enalia]|uniref:HypA n=1 Tax=Lojkania enalia TaxID=147567 RepID=A0A9P4K9U8_9PLEO|nr:hypothetical protein CC78DRAFT_553292 [Didymosphaeria enalia]